MRGEYRLPSAAIPGDIPNGGVICRSLAMILQLERRDSVAASASVNPISACDRVSAGACERSRTHAKK